MKAKTGIVINADEWDLLCCMSTLPANILDLAKDCGLCLAECRQILKGLRTRGLISGGTRDGEYRKFFTRWSHVWILPHHWPEIERQCDSWWDANREIPFSN